MSTECENCKFREGDCGYHHMSDGITNYDIASLSACDKYGNCMFFERMAENKGDLISRSALKEALTSDTRNIYVFECLSRVLEKIDNAPNIEPEITNDDLQAAMTESYHLGYELAETKFKRPQGKWIECTKSGMPLTEYGRMMGEKWYGFKCSQCNYIYKGNALVESPYCQECGADMREEADNEH